MKRSFLENKKGQSIIEFALVLPLLLAVLYGITEFGRAIMVTNVLHTASREGARTAAVASDTSMARVQADQRIDEVLQAAAIKPVDVIRPHQIEFDLSTDRVVRVTVRAYFRDGALTALVNILNTFFGGTTIPPEWTLRGRTVMRFEG
jgi:Flp pilus assembly protein TadG